MNKRMVISLLLIFAGLGMFLQPDISSFLLKRHTQAVLHNIETAAVSSKEEVTDERSFAPAHSQKESDQRYQQMLNYNQDLYSTHQSKLIDEESYADLPEGLEALDELGYIEIPAMDVTLPLYFGASDRHMAQGAAVMAQTSMPIGGENTNCVIAGHRGYHGAPYFREIEALHKGDLVYVTNLWETLCYQVREISVIAPNDNNSILIREGEDLVTLLTCHPYRSHGKYRYLVICERCEAPTDPVQSVSVQSAEEHKGSVNTSDGSVFESSQQDIRQEKLLRRIGAVFFILLLLALVISPLKKQHLS